MNVSQPVQFYIEKRLWPATLPGGPGDYWDWFCSADRSYEEWHIYHWILRAFVELGARGMAVELVDRIPSEGIVIAHRFSLPDSLIPGKDLYLVCVLADKRQPGDPGAHPYAQQHIVQNPLEEKIVRGGSYIPYWPQPGLKPRDPGRGRLFENIGYFGSEAGLDLNVIHKITCGLKEMGINFIIRGRALRHEWHDYSKIDGVLAFRNFNENKWSWKPATKLYNAWLAGVPAILSPESAFRGLRKTPFDYIEAGSVDEILEAAKILKNNTELRSKMIENAAARAQDFTPEKIASCWEYYIRGKVFKSYENWRRRRFARVFFIVRQKALSSVKYFYKKTLKNLKDLRIKLKLRTRLSGTAKRGDLLK